MTILLGLDIGTTAIKAALYNTELGKIVRVASRPTPVSHPQEGWSEHDPSHLWDVTTACIREAAAGQPVAGIAISSMAEAGVWIDDCGRPLAPIIAWYDRRSEPQAARIEQVVPVDALYAITGQRASPSFGATKLLWLRENRPEIYARGTHWLPVPAYLLYRLCGEMAVDYTIAARTLLFDQNHLVWSQALLEALELSPTLLPSVYPGGTPVGRITQQAAQETGLPRSTICALGGHDHLCAALAAGAFGSGAMVDSTGSANALLLLAPRFLPAPALARCGYASYAFVLNKLYAVKGGLKAAGSAIEWLARQVAPSGAPPDYAALEAEALQSAGRAAGPLWLPHLIGSGTPEGDRHSRAALVGVQFEHQRGDLFRGLLEGLAMWTRHNVEEMQALTGLPVESFLLTGGATRLKLLSRIKANVLNRPVLVPQVPEAAAAGAGLLAGLGCRVWGHPREAIQSLRYDRIQIDPDTSLAAWYEAYYAQVYRPLYQALKPVNEALQRLNSAQPPVSNQPSP